MPRIRREFEDASENSRWVLCIESLTPSVARHPEEYDRLLQAPPAGSPIEASHGHKERFISNGLLNDLLTYSDLMRWGESSPFFDTLVTDVDKDADLRDVIGVAQTPETALKNRLVYTKIWLTQVLGAPEDLAWYAWLDPELASQHPDGEASKAWADLAATEDDPELERVHRALSMAMDEWRWCKFFGTVAEYGQIRHPSAWNEHKGEFDQLCSDAGQIRTDVEAIVASATSGGEALAENDLALLQERIKSQRERRRQLTQLYLKKVAEAP